VPPQDHFRGRDSVDPRHCDVGHDRVGFQLVVGVYERASVADAPDDLELRLEQRTPGLQRGRVIVGQQYPSASHRVFVIGRRAEG
jgi:hypothetical protein